MAETQSGLSRVITHALFSIDFGVFTQKFNPAFPYYSSSFGNSLDLFPIPHARAKILIDLNFKHHVLILSIIFVKPAHVLLMEFLQQIWARHPLIILVLVNISKTSIFPLASSGRSPLDFHYNCMCTCV